MPRPLRSRLWRSFTRFWQRDESLTLLLALLLVFAFVLPPLAPESGRDGRLVPAFFSLVLLAGATTVLRQSPRAARALVTLGVDRRLLPPTSSPHTAPSTARRPVGSATP